MDGKVLLIELLPFSGPWRPRANELTAFILMGSFPAKKDGATECPFKLEAANLNYEKGHI